jgi:hypothetical protein
LTTLEIRKWTSKEPKQVIALYPVTNITKSYGLNLKESFKDLEAARQYFSGHPGDTLEAQMRNQTISFMTAAMSECTIFSFDLKLTPQPRQWFGSAGIRLSMLGTLWAGIHEPTKVVTQHGIESTG